VGFGERIGRLGRAGGAGEQFPELFAGEMGATGDARLGWRLRRLKSHRVSFRGAL
jgi:hypothetical protein